MPWKSEGKEKPPPPRIFRNQMITKPPVVGWGQFLPLHLDTNWAREWLANFSSCARSVATQNWPLLLENHFQLAFKNLSRPGEGLNSILKDSKSNEDDIVWGFFGRVKEKLISWLITNTKFVKNRSTLLFSVTEKSSRSSTSCLAITPITLKSALKAKWIASHRNYCKCKMERGFHCAHKHYILLLVSQRVNRKCYICVCHHQCYILQEKLADRIRTKILSRCGKTALLKAPLEWRITNYITLPKNRKITSWTQSAVSYHSPQAWCDLTGAFLCFLDGFEL